LINAISSRSFIGVAVLTGRILLPPSREA